MRTPTLVLMALSLTLTSCESYPVASRTASTAHAEFARTLVLAEGPLRDAPGLRACEDAVAAALPELHPLVASAPGIEPPPADADAPTFAAWAERSGADAVLVLALESHSRAVMIPVQPVTSKMSSDDSDVYQSATVEGQQARERITANVRIDLFSVREQRVVWTGLASRLDAFPTRNPARLARGLSKHLRSAGVIR